MSQLKEQFESLLQEDNFVTQQLVKLEEKTGVKREFLAIGRQNKVLQLATRLDLVSIGTPADLLPFFLGHSSPSSGPNTLTSQ